MNTFDISQKILEATGASALGKPQLVQTLWSGYGTIMRYTLKGSQVPSVIVKHVCPPLESQHPRGWDGQLSNQRKLRSYAVELAWYQKWRSLCDEHCYAPQCYAAFSEGQEVFLLLEDLDALGFALRKEDAWSLAEIAPCIRWLASFHAKYLGKSPEELWLTGTYWHLQTRPDELEALSDFALKKAASQIDQTLNASPYQTFVHGDAKLANFCFSQNGQSVAAVDFQYVGGGCGMKDLAYFVGSALSEEQCQKEEQGILDVYFSQLHKALEAQKSTLDFSELKEDWTKLYPFAWADFHRFLKGWSPGHWKLNSYSEQLTQEVLGKL